MHKPSDGTGETGRSQPGTVREACFCIRAVRHAGRQIASIASPRTV